MTAFDRAWLIVKAVLPDLDLGGEYQIDSSPRFGMHSKPGDMEYNLYTMPGTAMDILDDFYSDEDWKSAAPYDVIGIDNRIREFERNPGLFDNPLNVAQRQNARHQGDAHPYSVFSSAMTDEDNNLVQRWLEGLEDEGAPANLAQAHVSPSGQVKNMFLNPGFERRGIGQHMLGAILQDTGRVGDDDYSVEGYQLWNRLGEKLTSGGDLSIHDFNDLAVSDKDYANWWKNRSIIDRVKGDFRFSRPTYGLTDNPVQGYTRRGDDGPMHVAPSPHPYQFNQLPFYLFEGRENHPLKDRFPLEIAYTGSDPEAVTNAPRTRTTLDDLKQSGRYSDGFF